MAKKLGGHVTLTTPPFRKILRVMSGLSLRTYEKSVTLTVLKLLAFNAQKFRGHVTLATPPFGKIFGGHAWIVPGNTCVKFEVRSFNRF